MPSFMVVAGIKCGYWVHTCLMALIAVVGILTNLCCVIQICSACGLEPHLVT